MTKVLTGFRITHESGASVFHHDHVELEPIVESIVHRIIDQRFGRFPSPSQPQPTTEDTATIGW